MTPTTVWIWAGLGVFCVVVLVLFGLLARAQRRREDRLHGLGSVRRPADLAREVHELEMVAADTMAAAEQALVTLEQAEADLVHAEADRELAWQAHTAAVKALEQVTAELEAMPAKTVLPNADQRDVSRAARDAYRRGELTLEQLRTVWLQVDGWGQSIEDKTHEVSRLRAEAAEAYRVYHMASHAERAARKAVEVAQVAVRALRQEATHAARDAVLAQMRARRAGIRTMIEPRREELT